MKIGEIKGGKRKSVGSSEKEYASMEISASLYIELDIKEWQNGEYMTVGGEIQRMNSIEGAIRMTVMNVTIIERAKDVPI